MTFTDRSYRTDRDAARSARKGSVVYPRLVMLAPFVWARQDADGSFTLIDPIPDPQSDGLVNVAA